MKMTRLLSAAALALWSLMAPCWADNKEVFDLRRYSQNLDAFVLPQGSDYDMPFMTAEYQEARKKELVDRLFGKLSPWDRDNVQSVLNRVAPDSVKAWEEALLQAYGNEGKAEPKIGYGANYRPYAPQWAHGLAAKMNLAQLDAQTAFKANRRAIAVTNLHCRLLPTEDVHFYSHTLAGEGFPFDNLQNSSLWAGLPAYVLGQTTDKQWSLVMTPDFMGWVKAEGLAYVDETFVQLYRSGIERNMLAIVSPETPVKSFNGQHLLTAYSGSVFPAVFGNASGGSWEIMIPTRTAFGTAVLSMGRVEGARAKAVPVEATPRQLANVMKSLLGRQYGWGNMYFYNDCSAELKGLFLPFGIYLARNSAGQAASGRQTDLGANTPKERIDFLLAKGRPLRTLVFIGGHVMLYTGNATLEGATVPMTFQNIWGLAPADRTRRSILGGSVLFPLLEVYPEDSTLVSLAAKSRFVVSFLDEFPAESSRGTQPSLRSLIWPSRQTEEDVFGN